MFEPNKTLFFMCECKSEVFVIEYDHEIEMADIAIFQTEASYRFRMPLWLRLRYACRVLFSGKPYADQIMLNKNRLNELKLFLDSIK